MQPNQGNDYKEQSDGWLTNEEVTRVTATSGHAERPLERPYDSGASTASTHELRVSVENFVAGVVLAGQYEVVRRLGSGGMGTVYKCIDKPTGRLVAVKILRQEHTLNNKIMQRFQREAQAIAGLEHPNLVKLYSYVSDGPLEMLIMEYIEGRPLDQELASRGAMSIERATRLVMQICEALSYVHKAGIVHRDLKPSNIILKQNINGVDMVKVVDFGIAKIKDAQTTTTSTGDVFGSPSYMSPEQAIGREAGDHADQYALGCVLFECLTGFKPFISENPLAVMMQHIRDDAPTLKNGSLGKTFPPELEAIVKRMMEKDPAQRFSSMNAVKDALSGKQIEESIPKLAITSGAANVPTGNIYLFAGIVSASTLAAVALVIAGWFAYQKAHPVSRSEAQLNKQADIASSNLKLSPSEGAFGVDEFDSPKNFVEWLRPRVNLHPALELEYVYRNSLSPEAVSLLSKANMLQQLQMQSYKNTKFLVGLHNDSIRMLDLSDSDIDDASVNYLANLKNLEELQLMGCLHLTTRGYATLKNLRSLKVLRLEEAVLTDDAIKEIVKIPELTRLTLNNKGLTANSLKVLAQAPDLTSLQFTNLIPEGKLLDLKPAKNLKALIIMDAQLSARDYDDLEQLKTLSSLDISGAAVTNEQLVHLVNALPKLTRIVHRECPQLSTTAIAEVQAVTSGRRDEEQKKNH